MIHRPAGVGIEVFPVGFHGVRRAREQDGIGLVVVLGNVDGIHLFTAVYVPKDDDKSYPILLTRTPYTVKPYGEDLYPNPGGPMNHYAKEKFIFALQDVRGKNGSGGTFVHMRPILDKKSTPKDIDESTDAYDTIDWLVKHVANNNGRVGIMGISYP